MTHIPYLQPDVRPDNDCSTRLLVLGIIMIMMGGLGACISLSVPFSLMMMRSSGVQGVAVRQMIVGLAVWPVIATALVWTGIGSIQKRRWVRPIVLVFASFGLLTGIVALVSSCLSIPAIANAPAMSVSTTVRSSTTGPTTTTTVVTTMPPIGHVAIRPFKPNPTPVFTPMPPPMAAPLIVGMIVTDLLIGVALPLTFLLLYRGQQVRTTLEFYDPNRRWTDACPIPVLGLAIASLIAAIFMPLSAIPGTMFLFGVRISGVPLILVALALVVLLAVTARQVYRLKFIGWQMALAGLCIGAVSSITTLIRTPMEEIYRASGLSPEQIQYSSQMTSTTTMAVVCVIWSTAAIAFVLYTRRFFPGGRQFMADTAAPTPPLET